MDNLEKWITAILNLAVFPILEGVGGPSRIVYFVGNQRLNLANLPQRR